MNVDLRCRDTGQNYQGREIFVRNKKQGTSARIFSSLALEGTRIVTLVVATRRQPIVSKTSLLGVATHTVYDSPDDLSSVDSKDYSRH